MRSNSFCTCIKTLINYATHPVLFASLVWRKRRLWKARQSKNSRSICVSRAASVRPLRWVRKRVGPLRAAPTDHVLLGNGIGRVLCGASRETRRSGRRWLRIPASGGASGRRAHVPRLYLRRAAGASAKWHSRHRSRPIKTRRARCRNVVRNRWSAGTAPTDPLLSQSPPDATKNQDDARTENADVCNMRCTNAKRSCIPPDIYRRTAFYILFTERGRSKTWIWNVEKTKRTFSYFVKFI